MIEPFILTSSVLFGREVLTKTVSITSNNIYEGIDKILLNDNYEFTKILEKLDINVKLDIINQFIKDIDDEVINKSTMKILKYLEDVIVIINDEIKNINNEIEEHSKRWFTKFRRSNCNEMFQNLKNHVNILDERFNLLLKLINI